MINRVDPYVTMPYDPVPTLKIELNASLAHPLSLHGLWGWLLSKLKLSYEVKVRVVGSDGQTSQERVAWVTINNDGQTLYLHHLVAQLERCFNDLEPKSTETFYPDLPRDYPMDADL